MNDTPNQSPLQYKTCSKCRIEKPAADFSLAKAMRDGLRSHCKLCEREYRRVNAASIAERKRERNRAYRLAHPEYQREYQRVWREANADYDREYRRANAERYNEYLRNWREANPEAARVAHHRRRARKLAAGGTHNAEDIRALIKGQTDKRGVLRCWHCGKPIKGTYHVDHFIPLAKGGTDDAGNLRISCPSCNIRKKDKMPADFNRRLL